MDSRHTKTETTTAASWFMVEYCIGDPDLRPNGFYGLKAGDGVQRGVPEGSRTEWTALIDALRGADPDIYIHKRLAWSSTIGVFSPRNTNLGEDVFKLDRSDLADLLENLLANAVEWTPNGMKP